MVRARRAAALACALAALGACWVTTGVAQADEGAAVIHDCLNNGKITKHWSQKALAEALAEIPASVSEYSDCPVLIHQAQIAEAEAPLAHKSHGGSGGGPSSGSTSPPSATQSHGTHPTHASHSQPVAVVVPANPAAYTPAQRAAVTALASTGGAPVQVGGRTVLPGLVHVSVASAASALPTPLLALFSLLLAWAAFGGYRLVRRRVHTRRER